VRVKSGEGERGGQRDDWCGAGMEQTVWEDVTGEGGGGVGRAKGRGGVDRWGEEGTGGRGE